MRGFDDAFQFIVHPEIEGGYVNDPHDPGGETRYGISKKAYPKLDIRNLTLEGAKSIYLHDYWKRSNCERLPAHLAFVVFDCAVNQGVHASQQLLQMALGVTPDGVVGAKTLFAMSVAADSLAIEYLQLRAVRYAHTANYPIYKRGWLKRLFMAAQALRGVSLNPTAAKKLADRWDASRDKSLFLSGGE